MPMHPGEQAEQSPTFCIFPFSHMATKTDGTLKLCCRSLSVGNVREQSAGEEWNGEKYREIRRKLLNGEKPFECEDCWELEEVGARSMRQRSLNKNFEQSRWNQYKHLLKGCSPDGSVNYKPKSIELKLSNICNLKCRMCHPVDSSSWAKDWTLVEDLMQVHNSWCYDKAKQHNTAAKPFVSEFADNGQWWRDFDEFADSIELIEFAGGEPLIDPLHFRILDRLERRAPHIQLKYSTNLTKLVFGEVEIFERWKKFKSISVYASIDGIHGVYDYIRTGAHFPKVMENLNKVRESKVVNFAEIAVACTIQMYNAFQLPDIIRHFTGLGVAVHTHRVISPLFLSVQVMPPPMKARLTEETLAFQKELTSSVLRKHLEDHLHHMNGKDKSHLLPAFVDFTRRMDKARGTDICQDIPELAELFK